MTAVRLTLLGYGETHLVALVTLLMIEFLQRMCIRLIERLTVAVHVDDREHGMTERHLIGDAASCYLILRRRHRLGAHYRQVGYEPHALLRGKSEERHEPLAVVHGEYHVKRLVLARAEQVVG